MKQYLWQFSDGRGVAEPVEGVESVREAMMSVREMIIFRKSYKYSVVFRTFSSSSIILPSVPSYYLQSIVEISVKHERHNGKTQLWCVSMMSLNTVGSAWEDLFTLISKICDMIRLISPPKSGTSAERAREAAGGAGSAAGEQRPMRGLRWRREQLSPSAK
jgi:hypothetical protein